MHCLQRITWIACAVSTCAFHASAAQPPPAAAHVLLDQSGARFRYEDLRGRALVVTFIATRCNDACPLIAAQISAAAHDARAARAGVRFLTLTLDPEHDSAPAMRRVATAFDARAPRWLLASGSRSTIHSLMRRFGVVTIPGRDGVPDMHTTFVYVLDSQQRLRTTLLASPGLPSDIFAAVARQ